MSINLNEHLREIAYAEHMNYLEQLRKQRSLTIEDLEFILTRALLDIKDEKLSSSSATIIDLIYQVQQLEQEKKKSIQEQAMQVKEEKKEE